jgi:hypothetical protein
MAIMSMNETTQETVEWFAEADLAERIGVGVASVKDARENLIPAGLTKKEGRRVLVTREAAEMLCGLLGAEVGCLDTPEEKKEAGGAQGSETDQDMQAVAKKIPLNPRLVLAELMGEAVRVRVPDSRKFVPGMPMRVRWVSGDLYQLVGRGPRFKGRY